MSGNTSMANLFDLTGKVVWMIGGAGYLGTPTCEALAHHGAQVIIGDLRHEAAEATASQIRAQGNKAVAIAVDIASEASIQNAIAEILRQFGRLDVMINATAYSTGKPIEQMSAEEWDKGLRVTLTGAFLLSRDSAKVMIEQGGGSIVHFGSMYGMVSPDPRVYIPPMNVNPVDYGVSKAGVHQMVRYQAVAWGPKNVRVNAIIPGPFPNPALAHNEAGFIGRLANKVPMGRVGISKEIAGAVVYLASDASTFTTGTQIVIDGGWTAW